MRARRLRILGSRGIPNRHGGFEACAQQLAPWLVARGWEVTVYCQEPADAVASRKKLVKASDEPVKAVAAVPVEKPGESVIDALVSGKQTMEAQAKQATPIRPAPVAPIKQEGVDASVIDSLLGGGGGSGSEGTDGGNKR